MTSDSFKMKENNFMTCDNFKKGTIFMTSDSFKIKEDNFRDLRQLLIKEDNLHDLRQLQNKGG